MKTVLLSAPYMIPYLDQFLETFNTSGINILVPEVEERLEEHQLLPYAGQIDGVICGDDQFTKKVIKAFHPRLKVISKWGTGIDSIDAVSAKNLGIQVYRTPNAFSKPVADTVMSIMLAFARNIFQIDRNMKLGGWEKIAGRSLQECTLGVVGIGNCGKAVVKRAYTFEMEILGNDIVEIDPEFTNQYSVEMVGLEGLLANSDFVSLNCDLNPTSYHLINSSNLIVMKPTAVLINTARGSIVDEKALIFALKEGSIAGAGLDVFEIEPLPNDSPLRKMDNVILSSHNANSSPKACEFVHWNTIYNLYRGLGIPINNLPEISDPR